MMCTRRENQALRMMKKKSHLGGGSVSTGCEKATAAMKQTCKIHNFQLGEGESFPEFGTLPLTIAAIYSRAVLKIAEEGDYIKQLKFICTLS